MKFKSCCRKVYDQRQANNYRAHAMYGITEGLGEERRGEKKRRARRYKEECVTAFWISKHAYVQKIDYVHFSRQTNVIADITDIMKAWLKIRTLFY